MDHIIAVIHPFTFKQEVLVYSNGKCIDTIETTMDLLSDTIKSAAKEYGISKVDLKGADEYTNKIKKDLNDLSKFNMFLDVDIY